MLNDRFENEVSTSSVLARDFYVTAVDKLLGAAPDMVEAFESCVDADPGFALGHSGLARARMTMGNLPAARATMAEAQALSGGLPGREASHLQAMGLFVGGKMSEAYGAIRAHVAEHPRDALLAQTCTSVFGLIGFSGQPGREAELLAYTAGLLPHYGDDWWCLSQHAFSLCETGRNDQASAMIDRSLSLNPRNAHAAHVRSHIYYETGETDAGIDYLADWLEGYDRKGLMHGHLSWHVALWALGQGDTTRMWRTIDADVVPGAALGLPINVLTDTASILYRAELAGESIAPERWCAVSEYAKKFFPKTGLGFVDVHAALAHAMAGDGEALRRIISNPAGPAGDLVGELAESYSAIANQNWAEATIHLTKAMSDHARIGGSRAQRDLLELTLLEVLLKQGQDEEAKRLLALRRPVLISTAPADETSHAC